MRTVSARSYILYIDSWPIEKLGVDASTVQHGVEGLMYLLTECSKLMVREICNCTQKMFSIHYHSFGLVSALFPGSPLAPTKNKNGGARGEPWNEARLALFLFHSFPFACCKRQKAR